MPVTNNCRGGGGGGEGERNARELTGREGGGEESSGMTKARKLTMELGISSHDYSSQYGEGDTRTGGISQIFYSLASTVLFNLL